jgi:hypothetical protein
LSENQNIEEQSPDDIQLPAKEHSRSSGNLSNQKAEISKSETENMEVHKHPHHVTHKKKWTEYLLEFLMLFLAVFLGFVAENVREHIVEHEREKKFAIRLLADLKEDSIFFQKRMREFENRQKNQLHFLEIMTGAQQASDSAVFTSFEPLLQSFDPKFNTATYNQMKASGGLRYIRNDAITSEVQKYYEILLPGIEREVADIRKVFTDRIVPYMILHFKFQDFNDTIPPKKYIILHRSSETDQEFINIMGVYSAGWDDVFALQNSALKQMHESMSLIRDEYHLK